MQIKKNISFTICDFNYLKFGLTLAHSFLKFESERFDFNLILVNYLNLLNSEEKVRIKNSLQNINKNLLVLWEDEILDTGVRNELFVKYDIVEYCTSIKALIFEFFLKEKDVENIIYLDPDINIYSNLNRVVEELNKGNIVLTPHISDADTRSDYKKNRETKFLSVGIFNLGFIGIKNTKESRRFVSWWNQRLLELCYLNPQAGLFVDQNWINFVPVFFEKVRIIKDYGYNIAYWNYRERESFLKNNSFEHFKNNSEICFIHFSARLNLRDLPALAKYLEAYEDDINRMDKILMSFNFSIKYTFKKNTSKSVGRKQVLKKIVEHSKRLFKQ
jgi:hypothetical protein